MLGFYSLFILVIVMTQRDMSAALGWAGEVVTDKAAIAARIRTWTTPEYKSIVVFKRKLVSAWHETWASSADVLFKMKRSY